MKLMKVLVALLVAAGLIIPAVAFANDNFTVNGSMRVEGFYDDLDTGSPADEEEMWFEQRFRFNTVYHASDDVSARIRFDLEDQWGKDGRVTLDNAPQGSIQTDYAYLQIDKEMFTLQAGQTYFSTPNAILVDHTGTGFVLTTKTPVSVKLQYTKVDEGSITSAKTDDGNTDDTNFYSGALGYAVDDYSVIGVVAMEDDAATDDNRIGYGLAVNFNLADVAMKAEFDILDGDNGGAIDYTGLQFYFDANTNVSEALNVGGWLWYAAGSDDANEMVIGNVTDDSTWNPLWQGYVGSAIVAPLPITGWGGGDLVTNAGLVALGLYTTFNASDDLGLKFAAAYGMEEEDAFGDVEVMNLTASGKYDVATNAAVMADVIYEDADMTVNGFSGDVDSISLWTRLQVNF